MSSNIDDSGSSGKVSSINRRTVLRRTAASGALVGSSGIAAASPSAHGSLSASDVDEAVGPYKSALAVRVAVDEHADVLQDLASDGHIESASVDAMNLDDITLAGAAETLNSVSFTATEVEGEVTPEIRIFREVAAGALTIGVRPGIDESYAILNPDADDEEPTEYQSTLCDCDDCCNCPSCCPEPDPIHDTCPFCPTCDCSPCGW